MTDRPVLAKPYDELTVDEKKALFDTYKLLVDMADKVSQRRQTANGFYLSVNTALIGASAWAATAGSGWQNTAVLSGAGILVAILWTRNIETYKDLNGGKFHVITEIEDSIPFAPFRAEWAHLERGVPKGAGKKRDYRPFHSVEMLVPWIFAGLHAVQICRIVPWERWISVTC